MGRQWQYFYTYKDMGNRAIELTSVRGQIDIRIQKLTRNEEYTQHTPLEVLKRRPSPLQFRQQVGNRFGDFTIGGGREGGKKRCCLGAVYWRGLLTGIQVLVF
jgi:hypothetical protein